MENLYQEIELQVTRLLDYLLAAAGAEDCRQTGELHRQILQALDVRMELLYQNMDTEEHSADSVHRDSLCAPRFSWRKIRHLTVRKCATGSKYTGICAAAPDTSHLWTR